MTKFLSPPSDNCSYPRLVVNFQTVFVNKIISTDNTVLIILFTKTVWKFTTKRGYEQLSDGGDRNFVKGRNLYKDGEYEQAVRYLKKAAKHKHFKSLFLLGEAYEKGHFFEPDLVKAAGCYFKASQKGYEPAIKRYQEIVKSLSAEQKTEAESLWFKV